MILKAGHLPCHPISMDPRRCHKLRPARSALPRERVRSLTHSGHRIENQPSAHPPNSYVDAFASGRLATTTWRLRLLRWRDGPGRRASAKSLTPRATPRGQGSSTGRLATAQLCLLFTEVFRKGCLVKASHSGKVVCPVEAKWVLRKTTSFLSCFPSAVDQRPVSAVMGHSVRRMCIKRRDQSDHKHSLNLSMVRNHKVRRKSKP